MILGIRASKHYDRLMINVMISIKYGTTLCVAKNNFFKTGNRLDPISLRALQNT